MKRRPYIADLRLEYGSSQFLIKGRWSISQWFIPEMQEIMIMRDHNITDL
jgi:hypothetical protein